MSTVIRSLEPRLLWNYFSDLNAVPRASKKEERVIAFMLQFGRDLGLETLKDEVGNVIIRKPATPGMEDRKTVVMQSHLDMVHQKNADTDFDFDTQGIEMFVVDDWVKAKGTTLGADNGLGVATIMAVLASKEMAHPAIEALFTIDEETGMTGAMGLKGGLLKGDILLNLDTEEDDEIGIGCAGGIDVSATGSYPQTKPSENSTAFRIQVKGLKGGHSGMDIHKGLGNANKIMNRLLHKAQTEVSLLVSSIDGGGLRNAIPRESSAVVVVPASATDTLKDFVAKYEAVVKSELSSIEPSLSIGLEAAALPEYVMDSAHQKQLLQAVYGAHNGVYAMSASIAGLVETSNNVARVAVDNGKVEVLCLTRSSVESAKHDLVNALRSVFELAGYNVQTSGDYPGWTPNVDSEILKVLKTTYEQLFREKPRVEACHAGLECGILGQNYPEMDMISFGPTIRGAHSPDERASISSVQKFWKFVTTILEETPQK